MFAFGFDAFGVMFTLVLIVVMIGFIVVFGTLLARTARGAAEWNRNNHSPQRTVPAVVAAKRTEVSIRHHHAARAVRHTASSTWYYVTFEIEGGDRMELGVDGEEYGLLVEGDKGELSFQGTRYLGFERFR